MTRLGGALSGALALALFSDPALAFKEAGHRGIEAAAYAQLSSTGAGRATLLALLDAGVLEAPGRPVALPNEVIDPGFETVRVDALVAHAHLPDHLMDRQLQADRQCFHFNARGSHTTLTDDPLPGFRGVPRGLVVDAYIECVGIADALLRGILFDPVAAQTESTDIYSLMHMVEDSYSDAHVARSGPVRPFDEAQPANNTPGQNQILFVKPWNLRTWARYMLGGSASEPVYQHFSESHHMTSDERDLGYLVGENDEDYQDKKALPAYQARVKQCLLDARHRIRPASSVAAGAPLAIEALYGDVVPPPSCLSDRALAATQALVHLLDLVATWAPRVSNAASTRRSGARVEAAIVNPAPGGATFENAWLAYRRLYLGHRIDALTVAMGMVDAAGPGGAGVPTDAEARNMAARSLRTDRVAPAHDLAPRDFKEAGFGLSVEVRGGTPLWLGIDEFVSRKSSNHNRTVVIFDTLGWSIQARLPVENELGERPVGIAGDVGPGLPLPLSELIGVDEFQLYLGVRPLRVSYTAQAIFEGETRHTFALGFGGINANMIVGGQAWLGLNLFRKMAAYDRWERKLSWEPLTFSIQGGWAINALL